MEITDILQRHIFFRCEEINLKMQISNFQNPSVGCIGEPISLRSAIWLSIETYYKILIKMTLSWVTWIRQSVSKAS